MRLTKRRVIFGVLAVLLLVFAYRVFAVYTVRSGECRPRPVEVSDHLPVTAELMWGP